MTARTRTSILVLAAAAAAAGPLQAQSAGRAEPTPAARERVSVSARFGTFRPTADSELYALLDQALDPGSAAMRPTLTGASLHLRIAERWDVQLGVDRGERTVASTSRARHAAGADDVHQKTTLELRAMPALGVEWQALRRRSGDDALRLWLGAGAGIASYRLRQWGEFVDEERRLSFADDLHSRGRGTFGYASAGVEVPLRRWVAVRGEIRHQAGSAPMTADFAEFDRLDLGGTRVAAGVRVHPFDARRR